MTNNRFLIFTFILIVAFGFVFCTCSPVVFDFTDVSIKFEKPGCSDESIDAPIANLATTSSEVSGPYINSAMTNYFYNFKENFASNQVGSCSFNALEILMNYFDNYLTDAVIPESLEVSANMDSLNDYSTVRSPGSLSYFDYAYNNDKDYIAYYDRLMSNETSLFAKLVQTAANLGKVSRGGSALSVFTEDLFEIFKSYLNGNNVSTLKWKSISNQDSDFPTSTLESKAADSELLRKEIISLVKQGKPVIVDVRKQIIRDGIESFSGHAVVAYDYDQTSDTLYYHYGYKPYSHVDITSDMFGYDYIYSYACINYEGDHSHSDNYVVNGVGYCSCKLPNHVHKYTHKYTIVDNTYHNAVCFCGEAVRETHVFQSVPSGLLSDANVFSTLYTSASSVPSNKRCVRCDLVITTDEFYPIIHP